MIPNVINEQVDGKTLIIKSNNTSYYASIIFVIGLFVASGSLIWWGHAVDIVYFYYFSIIFLALGVWFLRYILIMLNRNMIVSRRSGLCLFVPGTINSRYILAPYGAIDDVTLTSFQGKYGPVYRLSIKFNKNVENFNKSEIGYSEDDLGNIHNAYADIKTFLDSNKSSASFNENPVMPWISKKKPWVDIISFGTLILFFIFGFLAIKYQLVHYGYSPFLILFVILPAIVYSIFFKIYLKGSDAFPLSTMILNPFLICSAGYFVFISFNCMLDSKPGINYIVPIVDREISTGKTITYSIYVDIKELGVYKIPGHVSSLLYDWSKNQKQCHIVIKPGFFNQAWIKSVDLSNIIPNAKTADEHCINGKYYLEQKSFDKALLEYNQAIAIDPQYAKAYYGRGIVYDREKNFIQAISDYNKAIEINPRYAKAFNNRGYIYFRQKNYIQAISDFSRAIKIDPDDSKCYINRGEAYVEQNNYVQAIDDFTKFIKIIPSKYVDVYIKRAFAYYMTKDYVDAWRDIHIAESLGYKVKPSFITDLQKASGKNNVF